MKLARQQKAVLDYITANPRCTVQAIRDFTKQRKPDMRISEINFSYQKHHWPNQEPNLKDISRNLIINDGKNKYNEVLKIVRESAVQTTRTKLIWKLNEETGNMQEIRVAA